MTKVPRKPFFNSWIKAFCVLGILAILVCIVTGGVGGGMKEEPLAANLQACRTIGLSMFAYANDNNGKYPDGDSSTEVFQKLVDAGYIIDPNIFYVPLSGKTKPLLKQKLKPENVSFDVTGGADSSSPDELPIVFLTGYKVAYTPGTAAIPLIKPYPRFGRKDFQQTWYDSLLGRPAIRYLDSPGIAVTYKSNSAMFKKLETSANGDGSISNFVSPDFKPDGRTYRQLTPDGVLP